MRRFPIGAEFSNDGVDFRVWAPDHTQVNLILEATQEEIPLKKEQDGYFSLFIPHLKKGTLYRFNCNNSPSENGYPDPASRYQPFGVFGPSAIVDHFFPWSDEKWPGVKIEEQIIYELHIGTFTEEGTFEAATRELKHLAELGITTIELMPLNEFPGQFGWGYDGVNLFAPYHVYGTPDDLKTMINQAHMLGLGVILDVVYNHFGPDGNFIPKFASSFLHEEKTTEWGDAINFDHPSTREFFLTNARYWIEEFHFDGLRVDATPCIFSDRTPHILCELTQVVRKARPEKTKILVGESEAQDVTLLQSYEKGGYQFDAMWNDDFHHTALVRLKGHREAYYTDYLGSPQEFISSFKYGYLYQGQYYSWQEQNRGSFDLSLPSYSKIIFIENHDQVANTATGKRLHQLVDPGNYRALTALLLLGPNLPMLFQGQEFGSTAPFHYFADHNKEIAQLTDHGRKEFLSQFPRLATPEARHAVRNPSNWETFKKSKLDFSEREKNRQNYQLHKDLIRLRKQDPIFKKVTQLPFDGAILNENAFLMRYFGGPLGDRLIIVNFGIDFTFNPAPEPLIAPGQQKEWGLLWSSEFFIYGGEGIPPLTYPLWQIPARSATVLQTKGINATDTDETEIR